MRLLRAVETITSVAIPFLLLPSTTAASSSIPLTIRDAAAVSASDLPRIEALSSGPTGVDLTFDLPTLSVENVTIGDQTFQVAAIPGGGLEGEVGQPGIPTFTRLISIPDGVGYTIRAVADSEAELTGYNLMPVQADEGSRFAFDAAAYARTDYGAIPLASMGAPAISRDLRVVPITFRPVQFDPSRNTLRIAQRMRVEVRFQGSDSRNARAIHRDRIPASFDRLYRELVVNYPAPPEGPAPPKGALAPGFTVSPGTYLVICPDSADVISRLRPLLAWRTRMGFSVRLATTTETGTDAGSIKAFIQSVYDTTAVPLEYVCLVGDAADSPYVIPTFHESLSGMNGEGDYEYTLLAGDDMLPDIHIGRLSIASVDELENEVAKSIGYESAPFVQDTSWFKRAFLVGDTRGGTGFSAIQVQQWIKTRLVALGYAEIDTLFGAPDWVGAMRDALDRGDTIFSYRGMLTYSGWTNGNTYALTNGWKLPFCVTITCETGSFETDASCPTEGFLRAGSPVDPRGGIGAIGTATYGTHTRYNNCIHLGIFYGLLYAGQTTMGSALTRGKYEMYLNYGADDPIHVYIWSTWNNLMGDPAVDVFLDVPDHADVDRPTSIPTGTNVVSFLVHHDDGTAIPNALVCLYKGTETHATGYTGADGGITLPVSALTSGDMLLTVTKHNQAPYLGTIPVIDPDAFVGYQTSTIDDDEHGSSAGNGDGTVNPGETIELPVEIENFGSATETGVTGELSTADPYATVLGGSESFGDLGGGASAWSTSGYVFRLAPSCPDRHVIRFSLDLSAGTERWHSIIDLAVVSSDLVARGTTIHGDGTIDPGDTEQVSIRLANVGRSPAENPTAILIGKSRFIEIPDSIGTYPTIPADSTAENEADPFTIHATGDCIPGSTADLKILLVFSNGRQDTASVRIPIGTRTSHDPVGPDAYGYSAFDDTDITYPSHPIYQWIELDPALGGAGGTQIVMNDTGASGGKSVGVDIPFPFKYYGQEFEKGTVCSNGWLAMGSTYLTDYRNWTLPSGAAPDDIIAIFWDDLSTTYFSKCYQKYDPTTHRWIVEWSRFRDMTDAYDLESFEVILYDPVYHQTDTGDGKFLMQYSRVGNNDVDDGYATVGMQNQDHTAGLCYTYYNRYAPGAATLDVGRAILFTTPEPITPFQLISPANGDSIHTVTPELRWHPARAESPADTVRYSLFWSESVDFQGADSAATGTDTTYTFANGSLELQKTYHWRVEGRVRSHERESDPLDGSSFYVVDNNTPCLVFPEAVAEENGILITWKAPDGYDLAGFRVHRRAPGSENAQDADWRALTPLLPATRDGFRYLDSDVACGLRYEYMLEAFGAGGPAGWYGPVSAEVLPPAKPILRVQPNPGTGVMSLTFALPKAGDAVLRLFDLQGREIARRTFAAVRSGIHREEWAPRDQAGRPVPSGGYYVRLETRSGSKSMRWTVVR